MAWKGLGRHGIGNCNDSGRLLLEFCTEYQIATMNMIFQQKDRLKTTWTHPRPKHWHLLYYVIVRQQDLKDVPNTRVMPSAKYCTDHHLVHSKLKPKLTTVLSAASSNPNSRRKFRKVQRRQPVLGVCETSAACAGSM